jgi:hypothetical protein
MVWRRWIGWGAGFRRNRFGAASRREMQINASDGAVLRGWFFTPEASHGNGVMGLARLFVENHYPVLGPDDRANGESCVRGTMSGAGWIGWKLLQSAKPCVEMSLDAAH